MLAPALQERDSTRTYLVAGSVAAGRDTRSGRRQESVTRWGGGDPVERDRPSPSVQSVTSPTVRTQTPGSSTSSRLPMKSGTWTKSPRRPVFSMLKVRISQEENQKLKYFLICRKVQEKDKSKESCHQTVSISGVQILAWKLHCSITWKIYMCQSWPINTYIFFNRL